MVVKQQAIDRLRLDEAFVGKQIHHAFDECWTMKCDETLLVVDDDDTHISRFGNQGDGEGKGLLVINENKHEIILLSIDNQLLRGVQGGVADCALFDDEQFRFVEFKMNAGGNSNKAVEKTFDKAMRQLKNTIQIFKDNLQKVGVSFEDAVTLQCHVVLSETFPVSSARQNLRLEFATDTAGVPLDFSSKTYWKKV